MQVGLQLPAALKSSWWTARCLNRLAGLCALRIGCVRSNHYLYQRQNKNRSFRATDESQCIREDFVCKVLKFGVLIFDWQAVGCVFDSFVYKMSIYC